MLELRKHRQTFFNAVVFIFATGAVILIIVVSNHFRLTISLTEAIKGTFLFLSYSSALFLPCVFGAVTGSRLIREPEVNIEEVLPLTTWTRMFSAFSAGLIYDFVLTFAFLPVLSFYDSITGDNIAAAPVIILHIQAIFFVIGLWRFHPFRILMTFFILGITEGALLFFVGLSTDFFGQAIQIVFVYAIMLAFPFFALWMVAKISRDLDG